jgi:hypothetical protein
MDIVMLVVVFVVVGVSQGLVDNYLPLPGCVKQVLNSLVIIALTLWMLERFCGKCIFPPTVVPQFAALAVVSSLLCVVITYVPMNAVIVRILNNVVVIAVIFWLLKTLVVLGTLPIFTVNRL